jgi:hypothetical protein
MIPLWSENWLLNLLPLLLVFVIWFTPVYVALTKLRNQPAGDTAKALWALMILFLPILGAVAYLVFSRQRT